MLGNPSPGEKKEMDGIDGFKKNGKNTTKGHFCINSSSFFLFLDTAMKKRGAAVS